MRALYPEQARLLLRLGMAAVFLWFGINQLISPESFLGYAPSFLAEAETTVIMVNGIAEILLGTLLLLGLFTRIVALLLALHLVAITISLGYNEVAVRDFGLTVATFAIALGGYDRWTLDHRRYARSSH